MLLRNQGIGRKLMRVLAIVLAVALILPSSLGNVAAAAKTPKLTVTKTTNVYVGKKLNINVNNKIKGSSYKWTSSNKKIATVNNNGVVKGVKAGNATITCKVTAGAKAYNLTAKVKIVKGANSVSITNKASGKQIIIGDTFSLKAATKPAKVTDKITWSSADTSVVKVNKNGKITAVKTGKSKITAKTASGKKATLTVNVVDTVTVATQKELTAALAKKGLSAITIKTDAATTFTIPSGSYGNTQIVVNAPNADVINNGVFKNVKIEAIKATTWTERAKGNIFNIVAPSASLIVDTGAEVNSITLGGAKADIVVNGTLKGDITIAKGSKAEVNLSGATTSKVNVIINEEGTKLITSIKLAIRLNASADLTFNKGSEGSSVEKANSSIKETVNNNTDSTIEVTVEESETPTTTESNNTLPPVSGGGDSGDNTDDEDTDDEDTDDEDSPVAVTVTFSSPSAISLTVTSGSGIQVVTSGAIDVTTGAAIEVVTGSAIEITLSEDIGDFDITAEDVVEIDGLTRHEDFDVIVEDGKIYILIIGEFKAEDVIITDPDENFTFSIE